MNSKANGIYTDGNVDSLKHSGVQPWSAGATFPFVVFYREHYSQTGELEHSEWVVTLAGEELASRDTHDEADSLAAAYKQAGVRDRFDAHWYEVELAMLRRDCEILDANEAQFRARIENDDRVMYPNGKPAEPAMGTSEWHVLRAKEYQPYHSNPAAK